VLAAAGVLGVFLLFVVLLYCIHARERLAEERKSRFPLAQSPSEDLPPPPRVEQLDRLEGYRRSNVARREGINLEELSRYGQTDEKGFVQVPIDQAIRHLAGRLPARKEQAEREPRDNGLVDGGEPNSGRLFNRRKPSWFGH
jgi:hypothetical protein